MRRATLSTFLMLTWMLTLVPQVGADEVELATGETLQGRVTAQNEQEVVLDHPILGELTIPAASVAAVTLDAPVAAAESVEPAPAVSAEASVAEATAPGVILEDEPSFFDNWDSSFALGFSGSEGNSRDTSFNAQFKSLKEDETDRWIYAASFFYSKSAGERTRNEFSTELTKDWLRPGSPWFTFATANYQYDELQFWEHRVGAFGGVGYTFVDEENLEVAGRLGAGLTQELGGDKNLTPEGLIGASVIRWRISDAQTLAASTTVYPALDDLGQFRVTSNVEWIIKIDRADGLSLKFGIENEYESETKDDTKHNDLKYYGALVFDF